MPLNVAYFITCHHCEAYVARYAGADAMGMPARIKTHVLELFKAAGGVITGAKLDVYLCAKCAAKVPDGKILTVDFTPKPVCATTGFPTPA